MLNLKLFVTCNHIGKSHNEHLPLSFIFSRSASHIHKLVLKQYLPIWSISSAIVYENFGKNQITVIRPPIPSHLLTLHSFHISIYSLHRLVSIAGDLTPEAFFAVVQNMALTCLEKAMVPLKRMERLQLLEELDEVVDGRFAFGCGLCILPLLKSQPHELFLIFLQELLKARWILSYFVELFV